jgi:hypothetical protein
MEKKIPEDFDAEFYLNLHKDVKDAGLSAEQHYLAFGINEGRQFKSSEQPLIKNKLTPISDIKSLENDGIVILGNDDRPASRTIIIVGLPRSGTSMSAKALFDLGVWMGDRIDLAVFEDVRIAEALEKKTEDLCGIIEDYNNRFDIWGFKRPMAFEILKNHINKFRNPRILVMFRDPLAISERNRISVHMPIEIALQSATEQIVNLIKFSLSIHTPRMLVSYEKAISKPEKFIEELVKFAGCAPTLEEVKKAVSNVQNAPHHYLVSSQKKI